MKTPTAVVLPLLGIALVALPPAAGAIELQAKSAFDVASEAHNPFWPIGWSPVAPANVTAPLAAVPVIRPQDFAVTSILIGRTNLAVINSREVVEGDSVPLPGATGRVPGVRVIRIQDGVVTLQFGEQDPITVKLVPK